MEIARITGGYDGHPGPYDGEGEEAKFNNKNPKVIGKYGVVNILSHPRVAQGATNNTGTVITTVRRGVLVGKHALTFASPYGGRITDADVPLKIVDQLKDYKKYKGLGFELLYGLIKCSPSNGLDVGAMVISTYAAAHA